MENYISTACVIIITFLLQVNLRNFKNRNHKKIIGQNIPYGQKHIKTVQNVLVCA